jgi:hypothetical protein
MSWDLFIQVFLLMILFFAGVRECIVSSNWVAKKEARYEYLPPKSGE